MKKKVLYMKKAEKQEDSDASRGAAVVVVMAGRWERKIHPARDSRNKKTIANNSILKRKTGE